MMENEVHYDLIISTFEEFKNASEMEDPPQRINLAIQHLFIRDKDSRMLCDLICNFDPKNVFFDDCRFQDNTFDGVFCGSYGVESITVLNSNLTPIIATCLLMMVTGETLKRVNLSHNNIGGDETKFINLIENTLWTFVSVTYIDLSDNGFTENDQKKFLKAIKKYHGNFIHVKF